MGAGSIRLYLSRVITRIHNQPSQRINKLRSHRWQPE